MTRRASEAQIRACARAREKRSELDDAVTCNLAPDELALWRRVRGQFKGSAHARFEAFREYVESHPGELVAALPDVDAFPFGALAPDAPASAPRLRTPRKRRDATIAAVTWGELVAAVDADEVISLDDAPADIWQGVYYVRDVASEAA